MGKPHFCKFFLRVCPDGARYTDKLLAPGGLVSRLERHVQFGKKGTIPRPGVVTAPPRAGVAAALRAAAVEGEISRGETPYGEAVKLRLWEGMGGVLPQAVEMLKAG